MGTSTFTFSVTFYLSFIIFQYHWFQHNWFQHIMVHLQIEPGELKVSGVQVKVGEVKVQFESKLINADLNVDPWRSMLIDTDWCLLMLINVAQY